MLMNIHHESDANMQACARRKRHKECVLLPLLACDMFSCRYLVSYMHHETYTHNFFSDKTHVDIVQRAIRCACVYWVEEARLCTRCDDRLKYTHHLRTVPSSSTNMVCFLSLAEISASPSCIRGGFQGIIARIDSSGCRCRNILS